MLSVGHGEVPYHPQKNQYDIQIIPDLNRNINQKRNNIPIMTPAQSRMARAALKLSVRGLAELAGASHDTVVRFERGDQLKDSTVRRLRRALEAAGVTFIDENGGGPGARLRKGG